MTALSSSASSAGIAERFARDGYALVEGFLEDPLLDVSYRYARLKATVTRGVRDDHFPDTPSFYGDLLMDTLLDRATARIEAIVGAKLYPTYSYYRVYKHGNVLPRHKDRASCELSMTLCLGGDMGDAGEGYLWPMFVRRDDQEHGVPVSCRPGDGIVYRGCEVEHWREAFAGDHQVQVFLHYVDRQGPHADQKWDRRPQLGTPKRPSLHALKARK